MLPDTHPYAMVQPLVQFVYAILHARYPVVVQPASHIYFYLVQRCRQFLHPPPGRKFFEFGFHLLPRFRVDSYIDAASVFPQRESEIFAWLPSFKCACVSSMVMPSTPAAPLFFFTLLKALFRFSLLSIFSKSSGCTRFLSSHIRRNDLDAPTYSSCSALSFCGQPFSFRFSAISSRSSFPGCTWILLRIRPFTSRLLWPLLTSAYSA